MLFAWITDKGHPLLALISGTCFSPSRNTRPRVTFFTPLLRGPLPIHLVQPQPRTQSPAPLSTPTTCSTPHHVPRTSPTCVTSFPSPTLSGSAVVPRQQELPVGGHRSVVTWPRPPSHQSRVQHWLARILRGIYPPCRSCRSYRIPGQGRGHHAGVPCRVNVVPGNGVGVGGGGRMDGCIGV